MKAKITSKSNNELTIFCPANDYTVGQEVIIQDASKGTNPQNRFFHELVKIWFSSGCHSYEGDYNKVRDFIKRDIGSGFKSYVYINDEYGFSDAVNYEDIPEHIRQNKTRIRGKLKSWADYGKKERMSTIQGLIDNMIASGVNSKDFENICKEFFNV